MTWRDVLELCGFRIVTNGKATVPMSAEVRRRKENEVFYILCLYHDERTPSLFLGERDFHCYGCGAHGDVVDFVASWVGLHSAGSVKRFFDELFSEICTHQASSGE